MKKRKYSTFKIIAVTVFMLAGAAAGFGAKVGGMKEQVRETVLLN